MEYRGKREGGEREQVVRFRVGFPHRAFLFVVGTKSESDEENGKSMRVKHVHARGALVVIQHIENDGVELLTGYWAVPNVNRGRTVS